METARTFLGTPQHQALLLAHAELRTALGPAPKPATDPGKH